ncbi:hypothetical protein MACK_001285 [Theileria orientalis]|uniref:Uncharacterized protein n=1 Tax=Theileria orientalis TaxID=68886 RepID=A0A976QX66_THEOR|nr:hypothetical protein MACK_001285 [Theileria orientalis]
MQNDERNKDFIERMKELDKTNEKLIKPVREEKGLKSQASSGGSDTRSHAATIQPSLAKAASPKTVPVQLSSQEPSSSSTVSQKLPPRDRPSDDISQLTGPIEDGPSEDSFSRNATPEKETLEEKSRLDLQEQGSGQQLRVNEEEHSSPGLNDRQLEPTPAQASNTHTAQEEDGRETLYANKHNAESQILRQKGFNDSANQDNVPLIAGGAASGVGLIGSVVGYFAYTKYCKAKAPIQK